MGKIYFLKLHLSNDMLFLSLFRYSFGIRNVKTVTILNYVYARGLPSQCNRGNLCAQTSLKSWVI